MNLLPRLFTLRRLSLVLLSALLVTPALHAAEVTLSLDLDFNQEGDFNSGGVWKVVAKAAPDGISGVAFALMNISSDSIVAPSVFPVRERYVSGAALKFTIGDDLSGPLPLDVGVIDGDFNSSYADPLGLVPWGSSSYAGSFTGGVALVTGSFTAGTIPAWATEEDLLPTANVVATNDISSIRDASVATVVRYYDGLPGDYNRDNSVNAADYTVWRDSLGANYTLPGRSPTATTPTLVDAEDYAFWKSNFGNTLAAAPAATSVPEANALAIVVAALVVGNGVRLGTRRRN